jgi:hypothetical protein
MDNVGRFQNGTSKEKDPSRSIKVLLIVRDAMMRVYTDDILRYAGFLVDAITPWEAKLLNDGVQANSLVIFGSTL